MAGFECASSFPSLSPSLVDIPWLIKSDEGLTEAKIQEQEEEYRAKLEALGKQGCDEVAIGQIRTGKETPETHSLDGDADEEADGVDDDDDDDEEDVDFDIGEYDTPDDNDLEGVMEDDVNNELPPWS